MKTQDLESLPPTKTIEIENNLSLSPRLKYLLTIYPSDTSSSTKPLDEWKLKNSLIEFLSSSFSKPINVSQEDFHFKKFKDMKKRKRQDPMGRGTLCIRDFGFVNSKWREDEEEGESSEVEKKYLEWKKVIAEKMDGIEVNLEGVKYKLSVEVPPSDDFYALKKEWEESAAFGNKGYYRGGSGRKEQPDTIIMRGVPSRWFAEPRVSSKPSMLVTHTIFSSFGNIRNLNVAEDDDPGNDLDDDDKDLVRGLNCKVVVQYESHKEFYNALKVLCGRTLQKQGSRMKADYEVMWDKDGFFHGSSRNYTQEKSSRNLMSSAGQYRSEAPRRQPYTSRLSPEHVRTKRFKE